MSIKVMKVPTSYIVLKNNVDAHRLQSKDSRIILCFAILNLGLLRLDASSPNDVEKRSTASAKPLLLQSGQSDMV